ncbi:MAG: diphosphomevalonate decarboxylase [Chloroflexi bacterium]|nr:diphosphomevalonate decarboxylase [Chloroflexota bacterium]
MPNNTTTAVACANIAFIKYWGDRDALLRLPATGSISMNLEGLTTCTQVRFDPSLAQDELTLNGKRLGGAVLSRVSDFLDLARGMADWSARAEVISSNNFPTGAGIASSAAAFAALSLAASAAAGLSLDEPSLSRLARRGSGSACRSIPGGFVEWQAGVGDEDSFAFSLAPAEHWHLVDCIAVVSQAHKPTGSTQGHALAKTSPLHRARLRKVPSLLKRCRKAILERDFATLAAVTELDCHLMHAVMMTSTPPLVYWQAASLGVMHAVRTWRQAGLAVLYTLDAGPNVHVICMTEAADEAGARLARLPGVLHVLRAGVGGPARLESC